MLCDNCGKKEANVRYSENINGKKKTLNLCEECSKKLGINEIDFSMPINFSSFFGEFMEDFGNKEFITPLINSVKTLKCEDCGYTFDDIVNEGRLGCGNCYEVFEDKLDPIIKNIQGSNTHVGRIGKIIDQKIEKKVNNNTKDNKKEKEKEDKIFELEDSLRNAIKEERYEDAAKIRDELKKNKRK